MATSKVGRKRNPDTEYITTATGKEILKSRVDYSQAFDKANNEKMTVRFPKGMREKVSDFVDRKAVETQADKYGTRTVKGEIKGSVNTYILNLIEADMADAGEPISFEREGDTIKPSK